MDDSIIWGETFHPTDVTDLTSIHPNKHKLHKCSISALQRYKLKVRMLFQNKSSNKFCDYCTVHTAPRDPRFWLDRRSIQFKYVW